MAARAIAGFKALLKGGTVIPQDQEAITIIRSLPHGHVEAALGTARKIASIGCSAPSLPGAGRGQSLPRPHPGPRG